MRRLLPFLLVASFSLPATAFAEEPLIPSAEEEAVLFRPCQTVDTDQRDRCEARQMSRWKASRRGSTAFSTYDRMDLGQGNLRNRLRLERLKNLEIGKNSRRTFREFRPTDDVNTRRRSYVNDLRQGRLECMLLPHGRPRNLCLDNLENDVRKAMKAQSGVRQYPAQ